MAAPTETSGSDLGRYVTEKLRQKNTYLVALVVGTAINLYGHVLVPWLRGSQAPIDHFLEQYALYPALVWMSILIAYGFPLMVGLYSSVATRLSGREQERNLLRLASFPEKNPNPVIEVDLDARVSYLNPLAEERFPGLRKKGLRHPMMRDLDRIVKKLRRNKKGTLTRETRVRDRVYLQNLVYLDDAELIRMYTADITDKVNAEKDLVRLASFPEKNPNPVIEVTTEGEVSYVNPLARERFPDLSALGPEHPLLEGLGEIVEGIKSTKVPYDREIRTRGFIYRQNVVYLPESGLVRLFIHDVTTLKELQSRIQRNLAELEKAHQELTDAQVQLVESEKRAALSQLVAGIAHEINTPVGAIHSMHDTLRRASDKMVKLVEQENADDEKSRKQLTALAKVLQDASHVIETASGRVSTIVDRIKNFARLDEAEFKTVDVNESVKNTIGLVSYEIDGRIDVVEDFGEIPSLNCFPGRLNQAFLTVIMNSIQAIDGMGHLWVTTRQRGDDIEVEFRDDGVGIAEEHRAQIFEPGFTTKGVGVGTGLGLSICKRTVHDHGGEVEVTSEKGKGTTVTIRLPMSGAEPPPSSRALRG